MGDKYNVYARFTEKDGWLNSLIFLKWFIYLFSETINWILMANIDHENWNFWEFKYLPTMICPLVKSDVKVIKGDALVY